MSLRSVVLLIAVLSGAGACVSTDKDPVVVDPNAPDVSRTETGPVPDDRAAEPALLDPNRVVARVNDQVITIRSLRARYGAALRSLGEAGEAQVRQTLDSMTIRVIEEVLVIETAQRLGVTITREELKKEIEAAEKRAAERGTTVDEDLEAQGVPRWEWEAQLRREITTHRLRAMFLGRASPINPETRAITDVWIRPIDVKNFYERNREDFRVAEEAQVAAIYIRYAHFAEEGGSGIAARDRAREAARETVRRARAGEDFLLLMREYHEPMSTYSKPFSRGVQREPVEEFVWSKDTEEGEISDPIELASGFLVLKLERRQEEGYRKFEDVRDRIEQFLQATRARLAQLEIQLELLREAVVTPRRFKIALENQYRQYIQAQIEALSK